MLALMLLIAAPQDVLTAYRNVTRADVRCAAPQSSDEITVCGRRDADRYRVPLTSIAPRDDVPLERETLLAPRVNCGRIGMSFADCGFAGVTATTGGAGTRLRGRKLAP